MPPTLPRRRLRAVYRQLLAHHGPQHWWPAETPFEVIVGAVLTQNTAWTNVERAIANLVRSDALDPGALVALPEGRLAELLRPSGYFNVKAARLRAVCRWYLAEGGHGRLRRWPTGRLRETLLGLHGVGPETADAILLYAFGRPVFVIDAYARRLFSRLGVIGGREPYETLRAGFEHALGADAALFNEYHALIVAHAKASCRVRPRCAGCCLRRGCPAGRDASGVRPPGAPSGPAR
ncbi:MAG: endonuclease III domain-containing protein [Gammaproteobacteria bacterium]|nr:endonuclease III domain-containing protein [Gammaproteobacteria bacterium]